MATHIPYLENAKLGRAGALDYAVGLITIFAVWVLVQGIFQMGLFADPAIRAMMLEAAAEQAAGDAPAQASSPLVLLLLLGVVLAPAAYLFHRLVKAGGAKTVTAAIAWAGVVMTLVGLWSAVGDMGSADNADTTEMFSQALGRSAGMYALVLFSFIGAMLGGWLVMRFFHRRTFRSLITAARRIRWSRMVWVCAATLGIWAAVQVVLMMFGDTGLRPNPRASEMLPFVIATVLFIPIQCAAEEILFRGYMNQALARFVPSVIAVIAVSSILFGAMHLANPEIAAAKAEGTFWLTFSFYILMGVLLSILVLIDNGLESAIGVHTANNAFVAIFINMEASALPVPGMYLVDAEAAGGIGMMLSFLACMAAVIGVVWVTRKPLDPAETVVIGEEETDVSRAGTLEDVFGT